MGNSGGSLVTRSTVDLGGVMEDVGFTGVDDTEEWTDAWQVSGFTDAPRGGMADLVRKTGAPVVTVSFLDSDVGFVKALTPDGSGWEGLLNRGVAEEYEIPLELFSVESAVAGAPAWSAAAGLTADEGLIRQALTESAVFAEELSSLLIHGLGVPGAPM